MLMALAASLDGAHSPKRKPDSLSDAEEEAPSRKRRKRGQVVSDEETEVELDGQNKHKTSVANQDCEPKNDDVEDQQSASETEDEEDATETKPKAAAKAAKARSTVQTTLARSTDPYPDWKAGDPVPYAALCTTFSLVEMTTKRLQIMADCSLFLRQVMRLTPDDLLPTIKLMINKVAADYEGIELGIGESLIMKAIGESTGRSLQVIKADQKEIGDLGLVAAKSRAKQKLMFKPKPLTVRGVLQSLLAIATTEGNGSQSRKVDGINKLMSAADIGISNIDITKDRGGASEAKFIIRFLEGKLRLGLAERTVLVSLAQAVVTYESEIETGKPPSIERIARAEAILKSVYRLALPFIVKIMLTIVASCQTMML